MALPRFFKLPDERRTRLIAAAAEEFAANGYTGAVLDAIADKSGIGKSSFYYYFTDKADLCATVLEAAWSRLGGTGRIDLEALTADTFWSTVEGLARDNVELCSRERWLLAASKMLNRAATTPGDESVLESYRLKRRQWEAAWIARGQELGVIRTDLPTDLLVTISLGARQSANLWLLDHMQEAGHDATVALALQVLGVHRDLLSPRTPADPREGEHAAGVATTRG